MLGTSCQGLYSVILCLHGICVRACVRASVCPRECVLARVCPRECVYSRVCPRECVCYDANTCRGV